MKAAPVIEGFEVAFNEDIEQFRTDCSGNSQNLGELFASFLFHFAHQFVPTHQVRDYSYRILFIEIIEID